MSRHEEPTSPRANKALDRVFGSMPWLRPIDRKRFRVKVFKSGNSLALRLPAGLELSAGMEMDLMVENGDQFSFEPVERPKRKFNVAKVAGSAINLTPLTGDRLFEERTLRWPADNGLADDRA